MNVLVWHWGRRGAGPRIAMALAKAADQQPETRAILSLPYQAEILKTEDQHRCDLPVSTYAGPVGFLMRLATRPFARRILRRRLSQLNIDYAICAMPALLDDIMAGSLNDLGIPFAVIVHDAKPHPGDNPPLRMAFQKSLVARASVLVTLSAHVERQLIESGTVGSRPHLRLPLPPFDYGVPAWEPRPSGERRFRLLSFGRLLPYKGLDLLADTLRRIGPRDDLEVRVAGSGPESPVLDALRALPNVRVENRWIPEEEMRDLLAWSDGIVLAHREASQSGIAAAAIAARRWIIATRVGGIAEQLQHETMALLCEPDADALATAFRSLLASEWERQLATPPSRGHDDPWAGEATRFFGELTPLLRPQ